MRSTSRLLKAAEIDFMSSGVAMSGFAAVTSGIRNLPRRQSANDCRLAGGGKDNEKARPVLRRGGFEAGLMGGYAGLLYLAETLPRASTWTSTAAPPRSAVPLHVPSGLRFRP